MWFLSAPYLRVSAIPVSELWIIEGVPPGWRLAQEDEFTVGFH